MLKNNKGFSTADIIIAITIILIFSGLIAGTFYNYYLANSSKTRNARASLCIIDVIENVKLMNYEEIDTNTVTAKIEELYNNNTLPKQYTITADVQKYNEQEGNENKKDIIKIIKVKVQYEIGGNTKELEISTLITK